MRACAVIPAYRAAARIGGVLDRLALFLPAEDTIVVDDGSGDGTAGEARKRGVRVLTHPRNRGKGAAHRTAFREALSLGYDAVLTLDADGQHDPGEIPGFLKAWVEGRGDILLGSRWKTMARMPLVRRFTNRTTSVVVSLLAGQRVEDSQSGYRLISAAVLRKVPLRTTRYQTESELLIRSGQAGFRIAPIPIPARYAGEKSYIDPLRDTLRFVLVALSGMWR